MKGLKHVQISEHIEINTITYYPITPFRFRFYDRCNVKRKRESFF
jgi:hypothetical protein